MSLKQKSEIFKSLTTSYDYSYSNKLVNKFKKNSSFIRVIGIKLGVFWSITTFLLIIYVYGKDLLSYVYEG